MKYIFNLSLFFLFLITLSCKDDDNAQVCYSTEITMTINGEQHNLNATGYGIMLTEDGYILDLNFSKFLPAPYEQRSFYLVLPYKKTGRNIIQKLNYYQYIDRILFDEDLVNDEFESNVVTNTDTCFHATFSAKANNGNQEIIITDGVIKYEYGESLDD